MNITRLAFGFAALAALLLFVTGPADARPTGSTGDYIDLLSVPTQTAIVGQQITIGIDLTYTSLYSEQSCFTDDTDATITSGPSGASLNWGIQTGTLQWTPTSGDLGQNTFGIEVTWEGECLEEPDDWQRSPASDVESQYITVNVEYGCGVLFDWIGGPYPNPFYRGNPQKGDFKLAISDDSGTASGADLTVKVYNSSSQQVYTQDLGFYYATTNLANPTEIPGNVLWEGENQSGLPVAAGSYTVQVIAEPDSQWCDPVAIDGNATVF